MTGNKGEWSEIYALFKLLGDGELYAGDADLNKIKELVYPIVKIIRDETAGRVEFNVDSDVIFVSGNKELKVKASEFKKQADTILDKIKKGKGTFSIPNAEAFMGNFSTHSLKANSSAKTDIIIVIHDPRVKRNAELGFSIKSQLGNNSTLLNSSRATNFVYHVEGFQGTDNDIKQINAISSRSKIRDRIEAIGKKGGKLVFENIEQSIFRNNLVLVDSMMPLIVGELIKKYYSQKESATKALTEEMTIENPMRYETLHSHSFYELKVKRFLTDVAMGLMPSKVWNGLYDATGGYLIVKEDGDVLCYHLYNRNQFEDYLYHNTRLETPSSTRNGFGTLYNEQNNLKFKLNLQIRFL